MIRTHRVQDGRARPEQRGKLKSCVGCVGADGKIPHAPTHLARQCCVVFENEGRPDHEEDASFIQESEPWRRARSRSTRNPETDIATTIERLDKLRPESAQAAGLISLLRSWLTDESGYDEETWPKLKKALDQERGRVGARSLFDDRRRRA